MTDEKINKKNKFLKKLTFVIETEFGQPDDMILDLIEEHQISRKEVTEIYEQENTRYRCWWIHWTPPS